MKAIRIQMMGLLIAGLLLSAFTLQQTGVVRGKVNPPENALQVFAISGNDTVRSNIVQGHFEVQKLKEGIYQVWIEALPPYSNKLIQQVQVKDGEVTELGEIYLSVK